MCFKEFHIWHWTINDVSGFSDPYCMLGIQPGNVAPPSPQPSSSSSSGGGQRDTPPGSPRNHPAGSGSARALSDSGVETESSTNHDSPHEKLRKHHRWVLYSALFVSNSDLWILRTIKRWGMEARFDFLAPLQVSDPGPETGCLGLSLVVKPCHGSGG